MASKKSAPVKTGLYRKPSVTVAQHVQGKKKTGIHKGMGKAKKGGSFAGCF